MRSWSWVGVLVGCSSPGTEMVDATVPVPEDASAPVTCGANTRPEGTECVPSVVRTCGSGTHESGGACFVDAGFELRAPATARANGWQMVPVHIIGTEADGHASHATLIASVEPATAGRFVSPMIALGDHGARAMFLPCSTAEPSCGGTATLKIARASAPADILAQTTIALVAPPAIGSPATCLTGGNIVVLEGVDFRLPGTTRLTVRGFSVEWPTRVDIFAANATTDVSIDLGSNQIGIPLIAAVYENAVNGAPTPPGVPHFEMQSLNQPTCPLTSHFQVHDFAFDAQLQAVTSLTATFTQFCTTEPTKRITGCVRYQR